MIGTLRRECLDHLLITGPPRHLAALLREEVLSGFQNRPSHLISCFRLPARTRSRARRGPIGRLWGSRSRPRPVTSGDLQPGMIAEVSLRLLYLRSSPWRTSSAGARSGPATGRARPCAHLRERAPRFTADTATHHAVVTRFLQATTGGDMNALVDVLDPRPDFRRSQAHEVLIDGV